MIAINMYLLIPTEYESRIIKRMKKINPHIKIDEYEKSLFCGVFTMLLDFVILLLSICCISC